jgi:hypothetical protein
MNKNANPIDYIIWCAENDFKPSNFDILNAKDELKKLRERANDFQNVAWARLNNKGNLYDPRFCYNPYLDETTVVSLYCSRKEFQEKYGKLSK